MHSSGQSFNIILYIPILCMYTQCITIQNNCTCNPTDSLLLFLFNLHLMESSPCRRSYKIKEARTCARAMRRSERNFIENCCKSLLSIHSIPRIILQKASASECSRSMRL